MTSPSNVDPRSERRCGSCGNLAEPVETLLNGTKGPHYSELRCGKCGFWMGFAKKPDSDATKYRRPNQHRDLVEKYGATECDMCLLTRDEFPPGDTLHAHHVHAYADDGNAERSNLWMLCTACHRLVEFQRRYRGQSIKRMKGTA